MLYYAQPEGITMEQMRTGINLKIFLSDSSQDKQYIAMNYNSYAFITHS